MQKDYTFIKNHGLVIEAFECWPSFHDAEVLSVHLDRGEDCPCLEMKLHGWIMTNEVENGYFVLKHHHIVTLKFESIFDLELAWFNHQNAIFGLYITTNLDEQNQQYIDVEIDSAYGLGGKFKAYTAQVISVQACDKQGNLLEPYKKATPQK